MSIVRISKEADKKLGACVAHIVPKSVSIVQLPAPYCQIKSMSYLSIQSYMGSSTLTTKPQSPDAGSTTSSPTLNFAN